jgi:hypothetical protein
MKQHSLGAVAIATLLSLSLAQSAFAGSDRGGHGSRGGHHGNHGNHGGHHRPSGHGHHGHHGNPHFKPYYPHHVVPYYPQPRPYQPSYPSPVVKAVPGAVTKPLPANLGTKPLPAGAATKPAPAEETASSSFRLQCSLEQASDLQGIASVDVNITELENGRFEIAGRLTTAANQAVAVSATATGSFEENLALNVDGGGEITLRTEKDEAGEEFMIGKITLMTHSDDEGLGCSLEENK